MVLDWRSEGWEVLGARSTSSGASTGAHSWVDLDQGASDSDGPAGGGEPSAVGTSSLPPVTPPVKPGAGHTTPQPHTPAASPASTPTPAPSSNDTAASKGRARRPLSRRRKTEWQSIMSAFTRERYHATPESQSGATLRHHLSVDSMQPQAVRYEPASSHHRRTSSTTEYLSVAHDEPLVLQPGPNDVLLPVALPHMGTIAIHRVLARVGRMTLLERNPSAPPPLPQHVLRRGLAAPRTVLPPVSGGSGEEVDDDTDGTGVPRYAWSWAVAVGQRPEPAVVVVKQPPSVPTS